jgi:HD-GYP domain-containing protein (c-di-GMP phosphodiesterase class II)
VKLSFLARFTIVAAVASLATSVAISYVAAETHAKALQRDIVATAAGQASALLTPVTSSIRPGAPLTVRQQSQVAGVAQQVQSFQEYTRAMRLYAPGGAALFPNGASADAVGTRLAIVKQDVVTEPARTVDGEAVVTALAPLADPRLGGYVAVVALDISVGQIEQANASEQRTIVLTSLAASASIFLSLVALAVAAQRELNRRQELAERTFTQTMSGLAAIVDRRDPYTAGHSQRVAAYTAKLAERMRCSASDLRTFESAALLHDLGKIGIPDAVLLKPAKLDERERSVINLHPTIAGEILAGVEAMREILPCIVCHHERVDGKGYPSGLLGSDIPLGARIISVADAYDAMTTDRPYRRALSVAVARAELVRGASIQWDGDCIRAFLELIDEGAVAPPPPITDPEALVRSFGRQVGL